MRTKTIVAGLGFCFLFAGNFLYVLIEDPVFMMWLVSPFVLAIGIILLIKWLNTIRIK